MKKKTNYNKIKKLIRITFVIFFLTSITSSCMREYIDYESQYIERGYAKSVATIHGLIEEYIDNKFLLYNFHTGDSLVRAKSWYGQNVNYELVRFYKGEKYEVLYNPKDPNHSLILMNHPVFNENQKFTSTKAEIILISRKHYNNLWFGFLSITCKYYVNGREYLHWGGISKDLFFPDKDYNEITRKEIRQLKRKYKGKTCTIEYDVNNHGISRLVEESVVENIE